MNSLSIYVDNETRVGKPIEDLGIWNLVDDFWNEYSGVWGRSYLLTSVDYAKLDLFDDEKVSIVDSIQDIRDISKIFTSFSQSFTVPATSTNNKLFRYWYKPEFSETKNQKRKLNARIELNYQHFQIGKLELNSVQMKKGQPYAYNITFYGNTVTLKDLVKDFKISDLEYLSQFDHQWTSYDSTNPSVYNGLTAGLDFTIDDEDYTNNGTTFTDAVIYPLITHTKRLFYDSGQASPNYNGNLYYSSGDTTHGLQFTDIKPAIKIMHIIDAIQQQNWYGDTSQILDKPITFSSNFLSHSQAELSNLYMWLHRNKGPIGAEGEDVETFLKQFAFTSGVNHVFFQDMYDGTGNVTKSYFDVRTTFDKQNWPGKKTRILSFTRYKLTLTIQLSETATVKIIDSKREDERKIVAEQQGTGLLTITGYLGYNGTNMKYWQGGDVDNGNEYNYLERLDHRVEVQIFGSTNLTISNCIFRVENLTKTGKRDYTGVTKTGVYTPTISNPTSEIVIQDQMPDIKVIDFLTGVFKMFNLTAYFQDDIRKADYGKIVVDTLDNYYADRVNNPNGGSYDITEYVNNENINIEAVRPFGQIQFKYADPKTIIAQTHKNLFNRTFGELADPRVDVDTGTTYKIELPFEHMKYERLKNTNDTNFTTIQVGYAAAGKFDARLPNQVAVAEGNFEPVETKPLLFYGILKTGTGINYFGTNPSGNTNTEVTSYWVPSNTKTLNGTASYAISVDTDESSAITFSYTDTSGNAQTVSVSPGNNTTISAETGSVTYSGADDVSNISIDETILTRPQTINFGAEIGEYSTIEETQSLFNNFYRDYIEDIFTPNKRMVKLSSKLPNNILLNIKPNDRIIISGIEYTINKMTMDLQTGKTDFELLTHIV